jgi:hypothetical protein
VKYDPPRMNTHSTEAGPVSLSAMSAVRLFLGRCARQHCPSPLRRHEHIDMRLPLYQMRGTFLLCLVTKRNCEICHRQPFLHVMYSWQPSLDSMPALYLCDPWRASELSEEQSTRCGTFMATISAADRNASCTHTRPGAPRISRPAPGISAVAS